MRVLYLLKERLCQWGTRALCAFVGSFNAIYEHKVFLESNCDTKRDHGAVIYGAQNISGRIHSFSHCQPYKAMCSSFCGKRWTFRGKKPKLHGFEHGVCCCQREATRWLTEECISYRKQQGTRGGGIRPMHCWAMGISKPSV